WVFLLAVIPGGMAFLAVGFSIYLDHFIPLSPALREIVSLALLAALTAANYIGVKEGAWIQRIFTSLKIAVLLLLIGAAAFAPHVASAPPSSAQPLPSLSYRGIGYALTACLMAYNGWSYVSFVAGEIKNSQRNLPRAMALGMAGVIALYVGANIAYLNVMTVPEIAATERVGAAVAARIPFAQAREGIFFSRFGPRASALQNAGVRHRGANRVDRRVSCDRLLRDAVCLRHAVVLDLLHARRGGRLGPGGCHRESAQALADGACRLRRRHSVLCLLAHPIAARARYRFNANVRPSPIATKLSHTRSSTYSFALNSRMARVSSSCTAPSITLPCHSTLSKAPRPPGRSSFRTRS